MTAPERIWASSVTENYGEWQTVTDGMPRPTEYVRADLYAALEAQLAERVKVKPLEWSDVRQPDEEIRYHHIIAESPIGQWTIQWKGWKDYDDRTVFLDGDFVLNGGDLLEAAKAAAQADYERRVLSALEATPPARADRLKDEPTAFLVERIAGSGYGRARKVIDAAIYDPRRDDFWIGDGKKNHLVTPLYALSTLEATPPAPNVTDEFKQYRRKHVAELRPWSPGECMDGVSLSGEDAKAGSPKLGDMIARNPKNHDDKWLVAAAYFADNFEPLPALTVAQEAGKP